MKNQPNLEEIQANLEKSKKAFYLLLANLFHGDEFALFRCEHCEIEIESSLESLDNFSLDLKGSLAIDFSDWISKSMAKTLLDSKGYHSSLHDIDLLACLHEILQANPFFERFANPNLACSQALEDCKLSLLVWVFDKVSKKTSQRKIDLSFLF